MKELNEKAGILEFDNIKYRETIEEIASKAARLTNHDEYIPFLNDRFARIEVTDLGLSWMKRLVVYVDNNSDIEDAGLLCNPNLKGSFYILDDEGNFEFATIYILNLGYQSFKEKEKRILETIYHELKHLYDHSKTKHIYYNDEYYLLDMDPEERIDLSRFDNGNIDVTELNDSEISKILAECMNYGNFTETHAYLENINFEMYGFLMYKHYLKYNSKKESFIHSSKILMDIAALNNVLGCFLRQDNDYLDRMFERHQDERNLIVTRYRRNPKGSGYVGHFFNSMKDILMFYKRKFEKILSHAYVLYDYYYELKDCKETQDMSESMKMMLRRRQIKSMRKSEDCTYENRLKVFEQIMSTVDESISNALSNYVIDSQEITESYTSGIALTGKMLHPEGTDDIVSVILFDGTDMPKRFDIEDCSEDKWMAVRRILAGIDDVSKFSTDIKNANRSCPALKRDIDKDSNYWKSHASDYVVGNCRVAEIAASHGLNPYLAMEAFLGNVREMK